MAKEIDLAGSIMAVAVELGRLGIEADTGPWLKPGGALRIGQQYKRKARPAGNRKRNYRRCIKESAGRKRRGALPPLRYYSIILINVPALSRSLSFIPLRMANSS